jgi:hypothetical protein
MGGVVGGLASETFHYDWIRLKTKTWIKPGTKGTAAITYKYGIAGQSFVRRARYVSNIVIEKTLVRSLHIEDTEEAI